jgi:hypothetical protein
LEDSSPSESGSGRQSFSSEVLGSLKLTMDDGSTRPLSIHSASNQSDGGSEGIPRYDESSGSESDSEEDEEKIVIY